MDVSVYAIMTCDYYRISINGICPKIAALLERAIVAYLHAEQNIYVIVTKLEITKHEATNSSSCTASKYSQCIRTEFQ